MKEAKAIEILNKMRDGIKEACECGLTSSSEKEEWSKEAEAIQKILTLNDRRKKGIEKMANKISRLNISDQYCKDECPHEVPTSKKCAECIKKYYKV